MIWTWWKNYRRRRICAEPFPESWEHVLRDHVPLFRLLSGEERAKLQDDIRILLAEKNWEGCGGLHLTDRMKVLIASQACLLIVHLQHEYYRRVKSILVYPDTFIAPIVQHGPGGVVGEGGVAAEGQAADTGTVILAWTPVVEGAADPHDGRNVVMHEFAHKLDMLDGFVDGTPPLSDRRQYEAWTRIMSEHYQQLRDDVAAGRATLLGSYAATSPAEFFAVATEHFFEIPSTLKRRYPDLYRLLSDFYRTDPVARHQRIIGEAARQSELPPPDETL